ncbi:MAG: kinase/pyrophosphorylase, partial [Pseudomonadota bacterium]|nr:kinase/pyrophosphorylase [Pseudomonadota bacterium]
DTLNFRNQATEQAFVVKEKTTAEVPKEIELAISELAGQFDTYADLDSINDELKSARRLFSSQNWPVLDVSRRSIEETAAAILHLYVNQREQKLNEMQEQDQPS